MAEDLKSDNKISDNKIVVELQKKSIIEDILVGVVLLVISFVCWIIYKNWEGIGGTIALVIGCITFGLGLYSTIENLYSYFNRIVIEIDDDGVCIRRKKRKLSWAQIQSLTCERKATFYDKNEYNKKFFCTLSTGERLKVDFSYSNFSVVELHQQISNRFPTINCNLIDPTTPVSQQSLPVDKMVDGKIVVKYSKSDVLFGLGFEIVLLVVFILVCLYLNVETKADRKIVTIGYLSIIFLSFAIMYSLYRLCHLPIAQIDETGIFWAKKKKMFPWKEIQSLTCKVKEDKNGNKKKDEHTLICQLNNGESLEADLGESNFKADELARLIKSQFPSINCELEEISPISPIHKQKQKVEEIEKVQNSSVEEGDNKVNKWNNDSLASGNKIVVEYAKNNLIGHLLKWGFALALGIFFFIVYFKAGTGKFLIYGCLGVAIGLPTVIWGFYKMSHRLEVLIDENGVYWDSKDKKYTWDEIQHLDCGYKEKRPLPKLGVMPFWTRSGNLSPPGRGAARRGLPGQPP